MSHQVLITRKEINQLRRELKKRHKIVCLDETAYLKTLLVAQYMLMHGEDVKTPISGIIAPERREHHVR